MKEAAAMSLPFRPSFLVRFLSCFGVAFLAAGVALGKGPDSGAVGEARDAAREARGAVQAACPAQGQASGAPNGRILLVSLDPVLECAIASSLAPWGFEVSSVPSQLGPSMPSTSRAAQRLAHEHSARATVWISRDRQGHALWLYDAAEDRVVARPVADPPFPASVAAALASTVKTTLRLVGVYQAPAEAQSREMDRGSASSGAGAPTPRLALALDAGARLGPFVGAGPRLRYQVGLRVAPLSSMPSSWGALAVSSGEPQNLRSPVFTGHASDPALQIELGHTFHWQGSGFVELSEAVGLNLVRVWGLSTVSGRRLSQSRLDTVFATRLAAGLWLGPVRWSVAAVGSYWARHHDYVVGDVPVLQMEPWSGQLGVSLGVALD